MTVGLKRRYYRFRIWFLDWQTDLHIRLCSECKRERVREMARQAMLNGGG